MSSYSIEEYSIKEIIEKLPVAEDFFSNLNLENLSKSAPLSQALSDIHPGEMEELGLDKYSILEQLHLFLELLEKSEEKDTELKSIRILGGINKLGEKEEINLRVYTGEIVSIVGPTGSGKSRLLADIECMAQGDTPTKRRILINEKELEDEDRFTLEGKLVAQLSQNMNFVMDLSVREFLEMHAKSRFCKNMDEVIKTCFFCANELAGEKFTLDTKVTQLSGGQSRALMIADTAYMSSSPIILIDEIENAGIDRKEAIKLLAKSEKIVLMSTHDPLLALRADKRIIIKNGGIHKVLETSEAEKENLNAIEQLDSILLNIRHHLRNGERITSSLPAEQIKSLRG